MSSPAITVPERSSRLALLPANVRPRPWALLAGACVALAALSLVLPSQPTYDPWAWIVWGREVLHLDLSTTAGPSWKPLPVALTTVFALFGGAAPALWVLTARAGALAALVAAFRLGRRLGGAPAGVAAAVVLAAAPWFLRNAALGNSEGLQVAFALAALERAVAGRHAAAGAFALGLGLMRPEAWPFLGLYGAWLMWRRIVRSRLVVAGLAVLPVAWLIPELLGSGDALRAAHRAQQPVSGGAADADNPVVQVLREGWQMLTGPLHWVLVAGAAVALLRRDRRLLALAALAAAWVLLVARMTASGYSGNARYLIVPLAVLLVAAAAALAGAVRDLASRRRLSAPAWLGVAAAAAVAVACVAPWAQADRATLSAVRYQADLAAQLPHVVDAAGGVGAVRGCGPVATGAYLVPAVAWTLRVHIHDIRLVPEVPSTTLRVHTNPGDYPMPGLDALAHRPVRTLARTSAWRVLTTCGASR